MGKPVVGLLKSSCMDKKILFQSGIYPSKKERQIMLTLSDPSLKQKA